MQQTQTGRLVSSPTRAASRELSAAQAVCPSVRSHQVWTALGKARAQYAPRVLAAAQDAVHTHYQPIARVFATKVAPAHGLSNQQAEQLADRGLSKAIRDCRSWDVRGFELYVQAAIESELRNTVTPATRPIAGTPGRPPVSRPL
jgi:hypothetical protein